MLRLMQELADNPPPLFEAESEMFAPAPSLSPRELQIVQHILFDEKEQTIAARLGISVHTVHTHLKRIYAKLGVSSRVELILQIFRGYVAHMREEGLLQETPRRLRAHRVAA
jgi:DNA-binding CsgD family transcriptional regulator